LSSANSIAEFHIGQRQQEERYRDHDKDHVLHTTSSQSRPGFARINKASQALLPALIRKPSS
jgi:hypothetical protein